MDHAAANHDPAGDAALTQQRKGQPEDLVDGFGRVIQDLRLSVTDHCNLRCTYCMPADGLPWLSPNQLLSVSELTRLAELFVRLGIRSIRITGGEPLLRPELALIVAAIAALDPRPSIAMTTNGVGLRRAAAELAQAGLDRVNVSLDTSDWENYVRLTRRDRFEDVVAGLVAAEQAGLVPIKVNAVVIRGANDTDAADLLEFCLERGYQLRFIEQMPLDAQHRWDRQRMVTGADTLAVLRRRFTLTQQDPQRRGSAPAELYWVDGGPGVVGFVSSVSAPFCQSCDRLRLTADGMLRNCLFARGEADLRGPMRDGASDAELERLIRDEVARKARGHGIGLPDFTQPVRPMSAIGG